MAKHQSYFKIQDEGTVYVYESEESYKEKDTISSNIISLLLKNAYENLTLPQ